MPVDKMTLYHYGSFVHYAYEMYAESIKDPSKPPNLTPPLPADFPKDQYKLMAYLVADDMFNPNYKTQFYGFYTYSIKDPSELIIAIRGTESWAEWGEDAFIEPTDFTEVSGGGKVCSGFHDIFKTFDLRFPTDAENTNIRSPKELLLDRVAAGLKPVMTGHSLGSALANLFSLDIVANASSDTNLTIYPLASPKTGDKQFQTRYNSTINTCTRVTNKPDIVPTLPPDFPKAGWYYFAVGNNFEIDSSLDLNVKNTLECYHSLLTYLYMLNPSNPFGLMPQCRNF